MKKLGVKGNLHDVVHPQYKTWGCSGKITLHPVNITSQLTEKVTQLFDQLRLSLAGYQLIHVNKVEYYQSEKSSLTNVALFRFERKDGKNTGYMGEHISVVYDLLANRLLGFTRMQRELDNERYISHQDALTTALTFLKQVAPDLISESTAIPEVIALPAGERMDFEVPVKLDKLFLQWIGSHPETIRVDGELIEIDGVKVKFEIPSEQLWAWVIVDKNGQVETFERNISWDFALMQRKTQMWLHDRWLQTKR